MRYIVCVKQVPGSNEVRLDPETHAILRDGSAAVLNPQDYCALEAAVQLRKKTGGTVTTLSMGIPATEILLRDTTARGADCGVLLTDRAFAGADTLATSYTLSRGIAACGGADLILCGKNAIDGDTAQIGPELAAVLGFRLVTDVAAVLDGDETSVTVRKITDEGSAAVRVTLPAVLTVLGTDILPSLPTLSGVKQSLNAEIRVWNAADIGADVTRTGFAGSPTAVVRTFVAENTRRAEELPAGTDAAAYLLAAVRGKELLCMAGILINQALCIGCGTCADACAAGALTLADGIACVDKGKCIACGSCVTACPTEAIAADTGAAGAVNGNIVVFAERRGGHFLPVVAELLGKGRALADAAGAELIAVAVGTGDADPAAEAALLGSWGADRYVCKPGKKFDLPVETVYRDALCAVLRELSPAAVLFGATLFGRGTAPGVAALLQTGLTADCTSLEIDPENGLLVQTRPAFGGNLMASIVCAGHRPQMATVRPGVMKPLAETGRSPAALTLLPADDGAADGYTVLAQACAEARESIADAKIIFDCGRGIGSKKNLKLIRELAQKLGAAVGCTRPLVDTGMCEYSMQIGQTGTAVAPDVLILLGVSGAIQHLAGIGGAKKIIAVNTDPDAPVFASADVKIVADCMEIVKKMLNE